MAACPPRVEEKGPYKIRAKSLTTNVIGNCTDDEIKSSKPDDVDEPLKISCVEAQEDGVVAGNELLRTLSFGEFEDLLQEISTTPFTNKNCVDNNTLVKKLIDGKVIDEKCLENDASVNNWSFKPWSSRFGCKEGRRGFDRKSRLESCGASSSLDSGGGSNGGGSAASRTTQGGSLQNLHGKSELGKKSSLHKSGSLNTFPNASSYENCEKLAAVKSMLVNSVAIANKTSSSANQSKRIRNNGGGCTPVNFGTSTCCSAVTTSVNSSCNSNNNSASNNAVVTRTQCGGDFKDMNLNSEFTSVSSSAITLNIIEHQQISASNGIYSDDYTGCSAIATKVETDIPAEEKEMVMMMEVDVSNDGRESENIPLLKSSTSLITNGNGIDAMQERSAEMTEVDTKVTLPLTISQIKVNNKHEIATANNFPLFADDCRPTTAIHHHLHSIPIINGRQSDERSRRITKTIDDNGNPLQYSTGEHYGSFSKSLSGTESLGRNTGTDTANRGKKKSKISNKQKVINPAELDGYFGDLAFEVILERINSSDGHDANKLRNSVVDGKNKKSGNKTKKITSNKEFRKNNENEMLRMNGNKDDIKTTGFDTTLNNDSNLKDGNRLSKKKSSSAIPDESTSSGSHSPELDADDKDPSPPKNTHPISFSDVTLPNAEDFTGDKFVQGYAQVNDNLESSFVSDFYFAAEAQSIVEESEFHEVKKKKKKKPRSMYSSRSDGGSSSINYNKHQRYGGMEEAESGRNSSSAASWASLSSHRRGLYMSDDLRRKSTSSMPSSDHSSPDNSDVESVHSLPAGSTTLRSTISKTSSSSSCTPQASYADITKMTAAVIDSSNSYKFCPLSPTVPLSTLSSELEVDKREEVYIPNTSHVLLECEEVGHSESLLEVGQLAKEVKTVNENPEEPSIESSMSSSLEREALCDSPITNPGVEFVGGLELPEDTIEVSFGFEVNEQLLSMTEAELMALPEVNRDHIMDAELQMQQSRTEPMVIGANLIYGFPKDDHGLNLRPEHQGLINSHISPALPLITTISTMPHPISSFQSSQRLECDSGVAFSVPLLVSAEPIYAVSPSTEHQNIVDYVGLAWMKVSDELERESNDHLPKRVRYFSKN